MLTTLALKNVTNRVGLSININRTMMPKIFFLRRDGSIRLCENIPCFWSDSLKKHISLHLYTRPGPFNTSPQARPYISATRGLRHLYFVLSIYLGLVCSKYVLYILNSQSISLFIICLTIFLTSISPTWFSRSILLAAHFVQSTIVCYPSS